MWADSMECFCYLSSRPFVRWKTPYERRFGELFSGPIMLVGAKVEHHPISTKDQARLHQFGKRVLPHTFMGYALYAGGS